MSSDRGCCWSSIVSHTSLEHTEVVLLSPRSSRKAEVKFIQEEAERMETEREKTADEEEIAIELQAVGEGARPLSKRKIEICTGTLDIRVDTKFRSKKITGHKHSIVIRGQTIVALLPEAHPWSFSPSAHSLLICKLRSRRQTECNCSILITSLKTSSAVAG